MPMQWGYLNVDVVQRLVALSKEVDLGGFFSAWSGPLHEMLQSQVQFVRLVVRVCVSVCVCGGGMWACVYVCLYMILDCCLGMARYSA